MGSVISFQADDDELNALPWIVTFTPQEGARWDSIPCGPYQREHALALAESVALNSGNDVCAVVEPIMPALDVETVQAMIQQRRDIASAAAAAETEAIGGGAEVEEIDLPPSNEIKAGIERVTRELQAALEHDTAAEDDTDPRRGPDAQRG